MSPEAIRKILDCLGTCGECHRERPSYVRPLLKKHPIDRLKFREANQRYKPQELMPFPARSCRVVVTPAVLSLPKPVRVGSRPAHSIWVAALPAPRRPLTEIKTTSQRDWSMPTPPFSPVPGWQNPRRLCGDLIVGEEPKAEGKRLKSCTHIT
jgi:hypothetical protein